MSAKKTTKPKREPKKTREQHLAEAKIEAESKSHIELRIRQEFDLNEKQRKILKVSADFDTKCIFIDGLFGTSKTYISVLASLRLLNAGKIDKILYVRNPVSSGVEIGHLPGTLEEKLQPFLVPFKDKLAEMLSPNQIAFLEASGIIEYHATSLIRGTNWGRCAVIVDEASSMTFADLILVMSRIAEGSKIFIIGDSINQADIRNPGLRKMFDIFNDADSVAQGIFTFEMMDEEDIVRSDFIKFVMKKTGMLKKKLSNGDWIPS